MTISRSRNKGHFLRLLLVSSLLVLVLSACVHTTQKSETASTIYYVNCSASSNGNGTQSSPWSTLASVDSTTFQPADTILFARGATCSGQLYPKGSGSSDSLISIDAYGTGTLPIIAGGFKSSALELFDQQYWSIADLEVTGGNPRSVYITGNTAGATLNSIHLTNLVVTGTNGTTTTRNDTGLVVFETHGSREHFNDIVINGVTAYRTQESEGITVSSSTVWSQVLSTNITIENSTVHEVYGDGIIATKAQNVLLQHNVVYNTGLCSSCGTTPSGLWEWYCQTCTIQDNESYANKTWGGDGGDFDIDYFNTNNTVQYNYGHDSAGYCVAFFGAGNSTDLNNVFRDNVCSNNERSGNDGDVFLSTWDRGTLNGVQIYNNTFYWNPTNKSQPLLNNKAAFTGSDADFFKNNLIYSKAPAMVSTANTLSLDNNLYWLTSSDTPQWSYNGHTYNSFGAYQSGSGQDTHGKHANPELNNPTSHSTSLPTTAFTLQPGSPALRAGAVIANNGGKDFYGNSVSNTTTPNIGAYNGPGARNITTEVRSQLYS